MMKLMVCGVLLSASWCCGSSPHIERVAALKQGCVNQRRAEEDALNALGRSSSLVHEQCARWAWRQVR